MFFNKTTMKKIYIAPATTCMKLHATSMIALSLNGQEKVDSNNISDFEQNVKGSTSGYNVWDDDWSKN